ncbi:protein FAM229A [Pezoporus wallicus]|uniref:protein FAM229A n=1 Tax=Pezoporus wallicus TaxID=35540 RepID=UPI0025514276|nr:protein FAM229A [Pezoporus wallicus]
MPPLVRPTVNPQQHPGGTRGRGSTQKGPVNPRGCTQGPAMSSQRALQARRFPIEAGDCPSSEVPPEVQEARGQELAVGRQLRRCPGSHCLTLPNVPIDVFIATGGSGRPRTS